MPSGLRTSVEGGTVTATACSSQLRAETSAIDKIRRSTQCSSTAAISLKLPYQRSALQRLRSLSGSRVNFRFASVTRRSHEHLAGVPQPPKIGAAPADAAIGS